MTKIAFLASDAPDAQAAAKDLRARYGDVPQSEADVIVGLGGELRRVQIARCTTTPTMPSC